MIPNAGEPCHFRLRWRIFGYRKREALRVCQTVAAEGADTKTVTDGIAALAAFDEDDPDAVVLDMMLPKRSGFLVLEHLKKLGSPPVVVMITANMGKRHMAYAEDLGVDAYLVKPVPLQRLVDTVIRLVFKTDGESDDSGESTS